MADHYLEFRHVSKSFDDHLVLNDVSFFVDKGETAVEAVARGGYDLVLMDVVLSGVDGFETARRIRALPGAVGRVPIIGLSGHSTHVGESAAREAGMDGYLVKPVSPSLLAKALAAAKEGK